MGEFRSPKWVTGYRDFLILALRSDRSYLPSIVKYTTTASVASVHAIGGVVQPRRADRFRMRVAVVFHWIDEHGTTQHGSGFTRDISTAGLFVYSATPPPANGAIELDVLLPLHEGGQGTRLQAPGRVVRVEGQGDRGGFAAISDFGLHDSPLQ